MAMIDECVAPMRAAGRSVRVEAFPGLAIDAARALGADFIVKGLRAVSDFESELQMAQMNRYTV
jgi:pantetheine-phosphate adenylyltransferase